MTAAAGEVLLLLHPDRPWLLVPDAPDGPASVAGQRFWPLGPEREVDGGTVRTGVAKDERAGPGARWVPQPPAGWPEPLRRVAGRVLDEDAGRAPVPDTRRAWMRRGWWSHATTWCDTVLAEGAAGPGVRRTADPEPVEHWPTSAVARVPTTVGPCWLKAVPAYFAREPGVLAVLGEVVPDRVPRLLATAPQPDGGALLLLADAGVLPDEVDDPERTRLAGLLGRLQADTRPVLDRLARAGTADRSPAALAAGLERVAADGVTLGPLTGEERRALRAGVPAVTAELEALAGRGMPELLGHGDLHLWNVLRDRAGGPGRVLIDWTDANLGPPGLDLLSLHPWEATRQARAAARDRYVRVLAEATGMPAAGLAAAVRDAAVASRVVQVAALEEILLHTEPDARWQYAAMATPWLRALAGTGPAGLTPPSS
jgi:hypothetical protein